MSCFRSGVLCAALALSGCGFHLQGASRLPPEMAETYLAVPDQDSPLARGLRRSLAAAGADLVTSRAEASAVLVIKTDEVGERLLSVSATGVPEEYVLFHNADFGIEGPGSQSLLDTESITISRDYRFDPADVLGIEKETEFLRQAMVDDIVQTIMRRIDLLARRLAE